MTNIILFSGLAQSGKTTSANFLKNHLENQGYKVVKIALADYLKFICKEYFGWDGNKNENGRTILQQIGTNLIRDRDANFWVDAVINLIDILYDKWYYVLIDDARFENEIIKWENAGYNTKSVKIVRENFDNGLTEEQKNHPSEIALNNYEFDYYIYNNSSLTELEYMIENDLLEWILKDMEE